MTYIWKWCFSNTSFFVSFFRQQKNKKQNSLLACGCCYLCPHETEIPNSLLYINVNTRAYMPILTPSQPIHAVGTFEEITKPDPRYFGLGTSLFTRLAVFRVTFKTTHISYSLMLFVNLSLSPSSGGGGRGLTLTDYTNRCYFLLLLLLRG